MTVLSPDISFGFKPANEISAHGEQNGTICSFAKPVQGVAMAHNNCVQQWLLPPSFLFALLVELLHLRFSMA